MRGLPQAQRDEAYRTLARVSAEGAAVIGQKQRERGGEAEQRSLHEVRPPHRAAV